MPLSSLVNVTQTYGPEMVVRYNGYTSADINGGPAPGYSSSQAEAAVERIAAQTLPRGIKFEWTDLTYQKSWLVMLDFGYSQLAYYSCSWF